MTEIPRESEPIDPDLCERLKQFRKTMQLEQRPFARATGTAFRTYQDYEQGKSPPKLAFLQKLIALGANPAWLLTGQGPMKGQPAGAGHTATLVDQELMGRVTDAVARLYKDERVSLAPVDLGRIAAKRYSEIVAATEDETERYALIKLVIQQLRQDLHATAAAPGTGKRSA